jgi:hypothetical protein
MTRLIIWVGGRTMVHGFKRRGYLWSETHRCYIYLGRELTDREFNGVIDKALREGEGMYPSVKIVSFSEEKSMAPDVTAQQAEEIMQRLAPERLKKKPGPKQLMEVE